MRENGLFSVVSTARLPDRKRRSKRNATARLGPSTRTETTRELGQSHASSTRSCCCLRARRRPYNCGQARSAMQVAPAKTPGQSESRESCDQAQASAGLDGGVWKGKALPNYPVTTDRQPRDMSVIVTQNQNGGQQHE